jgi:hypothetical protein
MLVYVFIVFYFQQKCDDKHYLICSWILASSAKAIDSRCAESSDCFLIPGFGGIPGIGGIPGFGGIPAIGGLIPGIGGTPLLPGTPKGI